MTNIIALLTDFGTKDHYVGVMKGVILTANPKAQIVDISHEIDAQDVTSAYFLLQNSYRYFPKGTIFVVVVDPGVGSDRAAVCVETADFLFLAPDNGVLSFLDKAEKVVSRVKITNRKLMLEPVSNTFHGRDVFAPVAGRLSLGLAPSRLGPSIASLNRLDAEEPRTIKEGIILGEVVSVDKFGNLITNIPATSLTEASKIEIKLGKTVIRELSRAYAAKAKGEVVALVGSSGTLEIAVTKGSAARRVGAKVGAVVRVTHG